MSIAREIASDILSRVERGAFVSYAQNYEDVILWRIFKDSPAGCYVDVGAAHPTKNSVTKAFYERNWRGINIDPILGHIELLRAQRPLDINLQCAVGSTAGTVEFAVPDRLTQSGDLRIVGPRLQKVSHSFDRLVVPILPLSEILTLQGLSTAELLKIDVEGSERDVLESIDWDKIRFDVVVVESTVPGTPLDCSDQWRGILINAGFEFFYFDGLNQFYVHRQSSYRGLCTDVPPNYFDNFIRFDAVVLAKQVLGEDFLRSEGSLSDGK